MKLSDNFTVGSDDTIGISVDTSDIDLADYYKKTETYSQTEMDSAITAVEAYNDTTVINLSIDTTVDELITTVAKKSGCLASAYGASIAMKFNQSQISNAYSQEAAF